MGDQINNTYEKTDPSPRKEESIENSIPDDSKTIETKKGNYLLLDVNEADAIKQYTGRGNVRMNMLFNNDIDSIIPRLKHWARADESIDKFLKEDVVSNIIHLYSALLKAYDYHHSDADVQDHPRFLYRGSTGNHHSYGFKSFTEKRAMAESFGETVFEVSFPEDIPYLSNDDIFNYAPHTSRREESEYLFSPFCDIKPLKSNEPFVRVHAYVLSKKEIQYSEDNLPTDINEPLKFLAESILRYKEVLHTIEHLERWQAYDDDYQKALSKASEIRESYKQKSEEVLNFIMYKCAELKQTHTANHTGTQYPHF